MSNINFITGQLYSELSSTQEPLPKDMLAELIDFFQSKSYINFVNPEHLLLYRSESGESYIILNYMGACPLYSRNKDQLFVPCDMTNQEATLNESTVGSKYREFILITNQITEILSKHGLRVRLNINFADMGIVVDQIPQDETIIRQLDDQFAFYSEYATGNLHPQVEVCMLRYSNNVVAFPRFIERNVENSFSVDTIGSLFRSLRVFHPFYIAYQAASVTNNPQKGAAANLLRAVIKRRQMTAYTEIIIGFFDSVIKPSDFESLEYDQLITRINQAIQNKKININQGMSADDAEIAMIVEFERAIEVNELSLYEKFRNIRLLQAKIYAEQIIQSYEGSGIVFNKADRHNLADVIQIFGLDGTVMMIEQYKTYDRAQGEGQLHGFVERFSALLEIINKINPNLQGAIPRIEINLMKQQAHEA